MQRDLPSMLMASEGVHILMVLSITGDAATDCYMMPLVDELYGVIRR